MVECTLGRINYSHEGEKVSWWMYTAVFVADIQDAQHDDLNMYQVHHH